MKRIILIAVSLLLVVGQHSFAGVIQPARLKYLDGAVMYRTPDVSDWSAASINTPLDEGDTVWCPDGTKAELQLPNGSMVRLDSGSQLNILANEENFVHLNLASGRLYVRTSQTASSGSLQIDADDTTVLPAARTRLRLDMLAGGEEDVSIFKGSAYVEGNGSRTKVRAGEHISLEEGHNELLPLNAPDSWESWNMERDRAMPVYGKADSYLPEELNSYAGELDANGSWVSEPEYGMVWQPSVIISDDWAPYREGYWGWRGGDYVWISFESWGWVPYHYGRWTVIASRGWCWIPPARGDVFWGPGYVGWYRTGNHVGWTPLAPGETYYGHGHYGRHSVNINTTTINVNTVEYRNRQHRGGLTVLDQNDFLKGRPVRAAAILNSSVAVTSTVGSPRIRPQRESHTPTAGQPVARPAPRQPEQRDMRDLRQRFPRVLNSSPAVRTQPPPASAPVRQQTVVRPAERSGGQPAQRGQAPRTIWRVRSPENAPEREQPRAIEPRGRERR